MQELIMRICCDKKGCNKYIEVGVINPEDICGVVDRLGWWAGNKGEDRCDTHNKYK